MPNWVFNTLIVEGNDQLNVARLKKQVGEPFTRKYADYKSIEGELKLVEVESTFNNPVFAFWNIIKPEDMHAYLHDKDTGVPKEGEEWFQSNNWYDWNIRNWGTKWDVAVADTDEYPETVLIDEGIDTNQKYFLVYRFDTAWSPPSQVIQKLSLQYPTLKLTLDYEEETGWGGEIEFNNGQQIDVEQYEWKCRECDYMHDETPFCDECQTDMCPECGYGEATEECEKHKEKVNG
jgi:hypothetical protein